MKNTQTALVAMLGTTAIASAQTAQISYDFGGADVSALAENTTYSVTVSISFEGGQDNLLVIDYSTFFEGPLIAGASNFVIDADFLAQGGSVTGDASGIEVNALGPTNLFAPAAGSPQTLFTFDFLTGGGGGFGRVTHGDELITTYNSQFATSDHTIVDSGFTFGIPSPGVLGVAGLGLFAGARRRRA